MSEIPSQVCPSPYPEEGRPPVTGRLPHPGLTEVPYFGRSLRIEIKRSALPLERVLERDGTLAILLPAPLPAAQVPGHVRQVAERWLKAQARTHLNRRVGELATRLGVSPHQITVKDTRSRWGSCSHSGNLSFSWRIVMAPPWIIDYLVVHELAHLREMNHSPRFWEVVHGACPDYKSHRFWLRSCGEKLMTW